jgi:hypothetical protein
MHDGSNFNAAFALRCVCHAANIDALHIALFAHMPGDTQRNEICAYSHEYAIHKQFINAKTVTV